MLERLLWQQLQAANDLIAVLQKQLGMVLDRQFYRPVTHPRTDLSPEPDVTIPLSDTVTFDEKQDQSQVEKEIAAQTAADLKFLEELGPDPTEPAEEYAEATA